MAQSSSDTLKTYREKRDFSRTPEPDGSSKRKSKSRGKLSFVVQKHDASRLHYDFRLELNGVLKSWAVTKGPSLDPADKRLAVRTEDHPLDYGDFEGVIPDGYGAGTVMLWDQGEWVPREDPAEGLKKGSLKFDLKGQRMKGGWALVLMKNNSSKGRENWLLIKEKDDEADRNSDPRETWQTSVTTNRDFVEIAVAAAGGEANILGEDEAPDFPDFVEPQLAKLRDDPPSGEEWLHELKFDGYRIQALIAGHQVRLITRNGKDWTDRYPSVAKALAELDVESAAIDGELVALDDRGHSHFASLQAATKGEGNAALAYYAFDLLSLSGKDYRKNPLTARKAALKNIIPKDEEIVRFSDHIEGKGEDVIGKACGMGLEGIISKKGAAKYVSGRGSGWIKSKCVGRDEFVIGGYRKSDKRGRPFASLLLGEFENGKLLYRGRVGTGFDEALMDELADAMAKLERKTPAFEELPSDAKRGAVWLTPKLVGEIAYTERTPDGLLRHPSFQGLREDKAPEDVKTTAAKQVEAVDGDDGEVLGIRISHPDRVVYEEQGATKREIAEYLAEIAPRMIPHIKDHPVSLVRCPSGAGGKCFYQKHHTDSVPEAIGETKIKEKDGDTSSYLVLNTAEALVSAAQIGALELHIWGSRTDELEKPDRLVLDLDPDEGLDFEDVKSAAYEVRDVLRAAGLTTFVLLTGGKGLHMIAPLERRQGWDEVKAASRGLARKLAEAAPDTYVAEASKAKRKGRIFIDWLRNERGATAVCPYSLRARPGAPVATPVRWDELSGISSGHDYTLSNIRRRLSSLNSDPWEGYDDVRQSISKSVLSVLADD
ncbi:DNA ligase D [Henriciella barbarensis]|uniref:DNA ligase (ATP) n=1 Tax=Henriciella barbarensis TaxID=86342 RepID=A0A399QNH3_9PROT|nr:DNA ligase D [Henriciella barbarensis]RIJ20493.1 DNA ligase D [Henriciella barbarensis]